MILNDDRNQDDALLDVGRNYFKNGHARIWQTKTGSIGFKRW